METVPAFPDNVDRAKLSAWDRLYTHLSNYADMVNDDPSMILPWFVLIGILFLVYLLRTRSA